MKTFEVLTRERKTSFTLEAVREAILASYAANPKIKKTRKRTGKNVKPLLATK